jgi:hypothetical protein
MNANLPKYMNIKDFCTYSGFSNYQFMRLADRAHLKLKQLGRMRLVDVREALAAIEALPGADKEVPVNLDPRRKYFYERGGVDELPKPATEGE